MDARASAACFIMWCRQLLFCFPSTITFSAVFAALGVLGEWPLLLDFSEMSQQLGVTYLSLGP